MQVFGAGGGLFAPDRNIIKHWDTYEEVFVNLIEDSGKIGIKHLFQALILFFIVKYPEEQKFAPTFLKKLYEQEILEDDLLIKWHKRKRKLDQDCQLYDREAQKVFRELISSFIEWLESAEDEGEEEGEEEEEEAGEKQEEQKNEVSKAKEEAMRKQKELIQKQKDQQQKMMDQANEEGEKDKEERTNILDIEVNDD
eukprot:CAMPEP_0170540668 /NCGR_PEP_ID=MMETSP0211-20121228/635_1 /TAXON_ID=311385 /ORGANISM="Pseudokeronopsis sp., Strain OXSARD2" /LENGTH=196 /DNA_ID=CAMNT_0010843165 /DNA_START=734 /DNA_END=1322 /DNA_ORIENTATION=+